MNIWIVEDGQLVLYERRGECCKCGECCCSNIIDVQLTSLPLDDGNEVIGSVEDDGYWDEWEGWCIFERGDIWQWWKSSIHEKIREQSCNAFVKRSCTSWGREARQKVCKMWPLHPAEIDAFPKCTYEIVRVDPDA